MTDLEKLRQALKDIHHEGQWYFSCGGAISRDDMMGIIRETRKRVDAVGDIVWPERKEAIAKAIALNCEIYICADCAEANDAVWPEGHSATWSTAECEVCGRVTSTCALSDWEWPGRHAGKAMREMREI